MATFEGSSKNDTITTVAVSILVTVIPEDTLPSDVRDDITGELGNDKIASGGGNDVIYGESLGETGVQKYGADTIDGGADDDTISGDSLSLTALAKGGNDKINGGEGINTLYGDAEQTMTGARGGNDTINGGADGNTIYGDAPSLDGGRGGNDILNGGAGVDIIWGEGQFLINDVVGGNDVIKGGAGADLLNGNGGNDKITGGDDADTFYFFEDSGKDQILDFDATEGDILNLAVLFSANPGTSIATITAGGADANALDAGDTGVTVKGSKMTIDLGVMFDGTAKIDTIVLKGVTSIDGASIGESL